MSYLNPPKSAKPEEIEHFTETYGPYGKPNYPFAVCTVTAQRRSSANVRPWIVCPKRMLDLRPAGAQIPPEIRQLAPGIQPGAQVRIWWEVKFTHRDRESLRNFEYTFDFFLAPIEDFNGRLRFAGPPTAIEVMTSSTRGGGLTEHLWDVLLGRPQRPLQGVIDSPYTPNYRQVFGRMVSQFFVKCETLAAWGGRTMWLIQDELLEYIEESTNFNRADFRGADGPGTFIVYTMRDTGQTYMLEYLETITGPTRPSKLHGGPAYMTDMVGAGYIPSLEVLENMLLRPRKRLATNFRDVVW